MECDQQKAESKKSWRSEKGKSLDKDFIRALNLLYSPEPKSANELRIMLEIEIAKQNKPRRPKMRTYPRRNTRRKTNTMAVGNNRSTIEKENNGVSGQKTDAARDLDLGVFDDLGNRDDIPRISIPDEDQNGGAVCKVGQQLRFLFEHFKLSCQSLSSATDELGDYFNFNSSSSLFDDIKAPHRPLHRYTKPILRVVTFAP